MPAFASRFRSLDSPGRIAFDIPASVDEALDGAATASDEDLDRIHQVVVDVPAPAAPGWRAPAELKVLLVEDNRVNQRVGLRLLERLGIRADLAGNGREALAALARQPYDLVLMDVHMPEMDGFEATRTIRQAAAPQPWIVAMTGSALEDDRDRCLAAGMDDFVSKPVLLDELVEALCRHQRARKAAQERAG